MGFLKLSSLFILCILCYGRDDPFTPLIVPKKSIAPYYGEQNVFNKANIELPSTARLIKKVEVTYQNIDGSIETKSLELSGRVDWRMPLILSQVLTSTTNSKQGSGYSINGNKIFIAYSGKLKRDFILKDPFRIVLDFDINMKNFKNKPIILQSPYFKSIRYGLHSNFIRIVLTLNGEYIYKVSDSSEGIEIEVQ